MKNREYIRKPDGKLLRVTGKADGFLTFPEGYSVIPEEDKKKAEAEFEEQLTESKSPGGDGSI